MVLRSRNTNDIAMVDFQSAINGTAIYVWMNGDLVGHLFFVDGLLKYEDYLETGYEKDGD
jgi:hypothetical protein